jgi:hypothetical protein
LGLLRGHPTRVDPLGWRGRWLVTGARGPIVAIEIDPPVHAHTILIPSGLRELHVSVVDPEALIAALGGR